MPCICKSAVMQTLTSMSARWSSHEGHQPGVELLQHPLCCRKDCTVNTHRISHTNLATPPQSPTTMLKHPCHASASLLPCNHSPQCLQGGVLTKGISHVSSSFITHF